MRQLQPGYAPAIVIAVCVSVLAGRVAVAGVSDSPVPSLGGAAARHVYTVPGVIKNNNLETVFICTNLDASSVSVAVEVFPASGGSPLNNAGAGEGVETMAPGVTATFATGATVGLHEDDILTLAAASLRNGSARIISTSKRIGCTAFLVDELSDPPTFMSSLKILSKTKQHGE